MNTLYMTFCASLALCNAAFALQIDWPELTKEECTNNFLFNCYKNETQDKKQKALVSIENTTGQDYRDWRRRTASLVHAGAEPKIAQMARALRNGDYPMVSLFARIGKREEVIEPAIPIPLFFQCPSRKVVSYLWIFHNLDIQKRDVRGRTVLHEVVKPQYPPELLAAYLWWGVDPHLHTHSGKTPLHKLATYAYLYQGGDVELIAKAAFLMKAGLSCTERNNALHAPYEIAFESNKKLYRFMLLSQHPYINNTDGLMRLNITNIDELVRPKL